MQTQMSVTRVQALSRVHSAGFLDTYAAAIKRYDLLERGQEQKLAQRWHEQRDRKATDALITSHLRLAAKIARRYQGYGLPLADLVSEANLGLVVAASRFQPGRSARFSSYALWWIKATIYDYILRSWSLVKIGTTAAQKKLFFKLRGEMRKLGGVLGALTPETAAVIAENLEVNPRDVMEMDRRLCGDLSLNARVGHDEQAAEWEAMLVDETPDAEQIVTAQDEAESRAKALRAALHVLTGRERRVLEARRLAERPLTLDELGRELSVSSERVRQIETQAFAKVRRAVLRAARDSHGEASEQA
ncbi:RNA polymerase sigma factor RpoH [Bradyrhizobium sp.]|jgi:RNA polymerase sigma-32 factor|uniref:RNA polymerase sigma factor RpoH n=1 Tax=Bradyrhizobium sp. TaxID=376 RepID=UPI0039C8827B